MVGLTAEQAGPETGLLAARRRRGGTAGVAAFLGVAVDRLLRHLGQQEVLHREFGMGGRVIDGDDCLFCHGVFLWFAKALAGARKSASKQSFFEKRTKKLLLPTPAPRPAQVLPVRV